MLWTTAGRLRGDVFVSLLLTLRDVGRSRATLELEVLALRHQLHVLKRSHARRLRLTRIDLCFANTPAAVRMTRPRAPRAPILNDYRERWERTRLQQTTELGGDQPHGGIRREPGVGAQLEARHRLTGRPSDDQGRAGRDPTNHRRRVDWVRVLRIRASVAGSWTVPAH